MLLHSPRWLVQCRDLRYALQRPLDQLADHFSQRILVVALHGRADRVRPSGALCRRNGGDQARAGFVHAYSSRFPATSRHDPARSMFHVCPPILLNRSPLSSANRPTLCGWPLGAFRMLPRAGNFVSTADSTWQPSPDRCADLCAENWRNPVGLGERRPSWLPAAVPIRAGCVPAGTARRFRCGYRRDAEAKRGGPTILAVGGRGGGGRRRRRRRGLADPGRCAWPRRSA